MRVEGKPWSGQRIRRELDAFLRSHDAWPRYTRFRAAGRRELWEAIAARGRAEVWAEEYGLSYAYKRHAWSDTQVREPLRAALRGSDVACGRQRGGWRRAAGRGW